MRIIDATILREINRVLLFLLLLFAGLYFAAPFLIPVAYAVIVAMLLLPLRKRFESLGISRPWATLLCVLLFVLTILSVFFILGRQIVNVYEDLPRIEEQASEKYQYLQSYLAENWSISKRQLDNIAETFSLRTYREEIEVIIASFAGYIADIFLIVIYVYVFLYFKSHFENFVLKLVPVTKFTKAHKLMIDISTVAEKYLVGKLILMIFLCIIYSSGFLLIGIEHAIFYALIAAVLSLIPYIGNIIGAAFPVAMALIEKDVYSSLAVVGLFVVVQFMENYIFEPLIVGRNVNLNPPFSILVIVLGGAVWGISGMILAIPYLGIMQIIFSYIEPLKPFGFLIGDTESHHSSWIYKLLQKVND